MHLFAEEKEIDSHSTVHIKNFIQFLYAEEKEIDSYITVHKKNFTQFLQCKI